MKSADFSANLPLKIQRNFTFFPRNIRSPVLTTQPHPAPAKAPIILNWEFSEEIRTAIILINNNNNKRWGERGKTLKLSNTGQNTLNTVHCKTTSTCKLRCINYTPLTQGTLEIALDRASDISHGWGGHEIQVNPRNPVKFTKTQKVPWNSVEILPNACLYNTFETYFSYCGYLLAVNSQIYLQTSSMKCANNIPKQPGADYVAKNWVLAVLLKAFPLVHFWSALLLKEQMMTSVRKTLKRWSDQRKTIDF